MIFTAPPLAEGRPDRQRADGHRLNFTAGVYSLTASAGGQGAGMTGFAQANPNADCRWAYMLALGFSSAPQSWRVEFRNSGPLANRLTTWGGAEVGALSGGHLAAQPSNAALAVERHDLRLLVPSIATPNELRIELGDAERSSLIWAVFTRVAAVLRPSPRLGTPRAAPAIKTTPGLDGRVHATLNSLTPVFKARLHLDAWDGDARDLADLENLAYLREFAMWPAGLDRAFATPGAVRYRRPDFARNMVVTRSSGVQGLEGLDAPGGPAGITLDLAEAA